eukprot:c9495_g1_i3.p1 GENE.c9495_g1_i3~~c9495_g1_i3.p1  ORF type:complete len:556 (+),score=155.29 c9495_g1_i3:68-1735(+)
MSRNTQNTLSTASSSSSPPPMIPFTPPPPPSVAAPALIITTESASTSPTRSAPSPTAIASTSYFDASPAPSTSPAPSASASPAPSASLAPAPSSSPSPSLFNNSALLVSAEPEKSSFPMDQQANQFMCIANMKACHFEESNRAPMDVVLVLDRSGSMLGDKLKTLQQSVNLMIDHLRSTDRLAIISYDEKVQIHSKLVLMDQIGKQRARAATQEITARGATNLSGALLTAFDMIEETQQTANPIRSVLLMTDGLANHGIVNSQKLLQVTSNRLAELPQRPSVYCFGYGSEADSTLLTSIAARGNGAYYFCETIDSIPLAFADCLGGLMSVVAQNIIVTVTSVSPDITINNIFTNFPIETVTAGKEYSIAVGDLFSEEERDILIDLKLPQVSTASELQPLIDVHVRYFNVLESQTWRAATSTGVARTAQREATRTVKISDHVDFHRNRVRTAQAMAEARRLGDAGMVDRARALLEETRQAIQTSISAPRSHFLVGDLDSCAQAMQTPQTYQQTAASRLVAKSQKHWNQRSCESNEVHLNAYATSYKKDSISRFSSK